MTSCGDTTVALGAYVLGALDHHDRAAVEAHLAGCVGCRDELAALAPLPGLMSRVTIDEVVEGPVTPDAAMLDRLLAAAAAERRRHSHRRRLLAAAAAVVVLAGSGVGVGVWQSSSRVEQVSATASGVHMRVEMTPIDTGTSLALWLSGVPADEHCRLVAVSDRGEREVAGSWEATYAGTAVIRGTTSIPREHLQRLVIETLDGNLLVGAAVPRD